MVSKIQLTPRVRFGNEQMQGQPIYQSRRFTMRPPQDDGENQQRANEASLLDFPKLIAALTGILTESRKAETPDTAQPAREVAGVRLELGGKQGFTAQNVKAEKLFNIRAGLQLVFESVALFVRKIWWLLTKPDSPGWQKVVNGLTLQGSMASRPSPGASA